MSITELCNQCGLRTQLRNRKVCAICHKENKKQYDREHRKEYYKQHKEQVLERQKVYYKENLEKIKEYQKVNGKRNREKCRERIIEYRRQHVTHLNESERNRKKQLRLNAISHYGGKCACCGEDKYEFLAIDHINGGGNKHRKELKNDKLPGWLAKNNFPEGFRILCHNCNMALGFYGFCPHQKEANQ